MRKLCYIIPEEYDRKQLKSFLRAEIGISSRLIKKLKNSEIGMLRNGEHVRTVDFIYTGDKIELNIDEGENEIEATYGKLDIVFEDDDMLVINKSPLVAMHPSHNHQGDTLANDVAGYLQKKGKTSTFRSIGRLDKGTSGLTLIALNAYCAARLSDRKIEKTYYAIADGIYIGNGTVDRPIYRPDPIKTVRTVDERGERAVTHWKALKSDGEKTLLEINLETGRTHQIRVHFASLGTPLVGDRLYGTEREDITHQALHCGKMEFVHPVTNEKICLSAPLPDDMMRFVKKMN